MVETFARTPQDFYLTGRYCGFTASKAPDQQST